MDWCPEAVSKRLQGGVSTTRSRGETETALEFASPVLDRVNVHRSIFFQRYAKRIRLWPQIRSLRQFWHAVNSILPADANAVSGLSSYLFTPGLYLTIQF